MEIGNKRERGRVYVEDRVGGYARKGGRGGFVREVSSEGMPGRGGGGESVWGR